MKPRLLLCAIVPIGLLLAGLTLAWAWPVSAQTPTVAAPSIINLGPTEAVVAALDEALLLAQAVTPTVTAEALEGSATATPFSLESLSDPPTEATFTATIPPSDGDTSPTLVPTLEIPPTATLSPPANLTLAGTVDPVLVYAGSLNRITYTLTITGDGPVRVTADLPAALFIDPRGLPPVLGHDPIAGQVIWEPDLSTGLASVSFTAINDLFAQDSQQLLKMVAETPGSQPIIEVAILEIAGY